MPPAAIKILGLLLSGMLFSNSCYSSSLETHEVITPQFDQIETNVVGSFHIKQSNNTIVSVNCEPKVYRLLSFKVSDKTLSISARKSFSSQEPIEFVIQSNSIRRLTANAPADITMEKISGDELVVNILGASDVSLKDVSLRSLFVNLEGSGSVLASGRTINQTIESNGSASFQAEDLKSDNSSIRVVGAGEAALNVHSKLSVSIDGSATVTYSGNPQVSKTINGSGTIEKVD